MSSSASDEAEHARAVRHGARSGGDRDNRSVDVLDSSRAGFEQPHAARPGLPWNAEPCRFMEIDGRESAEYNHRQPDCIRAISRSTVQGMPFPPQSANPVPSWAPTVIMPGRVGLYTRAVRLVGTWRIPMLGRGSLPPGMGWARVAAACSGRLARPDSTRSGWPSLTSRRRLFLVGSACGTRSVRCVLRPARWPRGCAR